MNEVIRIFVSSSHLSTTLMAIHAAQTHQSIHEDILLIDRAIAKKSLINWMKSTNGIHPWNKIINLSEEVAETHDFKPTKRKKIIRKIKNKFIIRSIYQFLTKRYTQKKTKNQINQLKQELDFNSKKKIELYILAESNFGNALQEIFPHATLSYFEHGIGEYEWFLNGKMKEKNFFAVFAFDFKNFLAKKNIQNKQVIDYVTPSLFEQAANKILSQEIKFLPNIPIEKKHALFILQNLEIYNLKPNQWISFLDLCLSKIEHPTNLCFLIKPHPAQSQEVIEIVRNYFSTKNLDFILLTDQFYSQLSIEIIFCKMHMNIVYVFSLFSASIFYLSHLYPSAHIHYFYSYQFLFPYLNQAPPQYRNEYYEYIDLMPEVFAKNCQKLL